MHRAVQGESVPSIAAFYGFADWHAVWEARENESLRKKRSNPMILYPGDEVSIPDREKGSFIIETGKLNIIYLGKFQSLWLRLSLYDMDGEPLKEGEAYCIEFEGKKVKGTIKDNGLLEEQIPCSVREAVLTIQGKSRKLLMGSLDPLDTVEGLWARLANMGYGSSDIRKSPDDELESAVRRFQIDYDLEPDGIPGPRTKAKIKKVYGC